MLNALANHGYLAHNGQNITQNMTTMALDQALNIPPSFGTFLHTAAVRTNPEGNSTNTFSLDDLGRHNILEHDASLSRQDAFFGNNLEFNETVFDQTRSHWQETIDVPQAAAARLSRIQTSNMTNPTFGFTRVGMAFSVGESAAYIIVLGNSTSQTANRTVVEYLFRMIAPLSLSNPFPPDQFRRAWNLTRIQKMRNCPLKSVGAVRRSHWEEMF